MRSTSQPLTIGYHFGLAGTVLPSSKCSWWQFAKRYWDFRDRTAAATVLWRSWWLVQVADRLKDVGEIQLLLALLCSPALLPDSWPCWPAVALSQSPDIRLRTRRCFTSPSPSHFSGWMCLAPQIDQQLPFTSHSCTKSSHEVHLLSYHTQSDSAAMIGPGF